MIAEQPQPVPVATFWYKQPNNSPKTINFPDNPLKILFVSQEGKTKVHRPIRCSIVEPEQWKPPSLVAYKRWIRSCKEQLS